MSARPSAALLSSTAIAVALVVAVPSPSWADGGNGGAGDFGHLGGAGGTGFDGNPGFSGTISGGGGGGAAGGGNGGNGNGGDGGTSGNPDGGVGGNGNTLGGGGGGGGFNGSTAATIQNLTGTLAGGNGGAGGSSVDGGGGGGGAGGYGGVATSGGISGNAEGAALLGGNGGNGGGSFLWTGGSGGDGGVAMRFTAASGNLFINSGTVRGGNGGTGGVSTFFANGAAGAGGAGIVGSGLTISNFGTIEGGLSGDGVTRANAITSTGGNNILQINPGSSIVGNVVISGGGTNRLELTSFGGEAASFDVSNIGATAQYQGFNVFRKSSTNTWTLTGTTTATTPWEITRGTLNVGADATLGDAAGGLTFSNGATLQWATGFSSARTITLNGSGGTFDTNGNNATLSGVISGAGGLTKTGSGVLTLTGVNTYTGGTAVNGGALAISSDGNLGDATGGMAFNGGTLQTTADVTTARGIALGAGGGTFDTTNFTLTVSQGITGSGGLTKQGVGALILDGANTYSGGTVVREGTLQLGAGGSLLAGGALTMDGGIFDLNGQSQTVGALSGTGGIALGGGTLTAGDAGNTTLAANIVGVGRFIKQGTGLLSLTGVNNIGGGTTVTGGILAVNGALTGDVTVGAGGTLGGNGTITGAVGNSGIMAPGNSIGTLNVVGSYVQNGGVYQVEVNAAGQSDRIDVSGAPGTATINGGTVQVLAEAGNYARSTTYTILSATGGVTGTYSNVTSNFAFLTPSLSYDANNVFLSLLLTHSAFASGAQTPNQFAVGTVLDQVNTTAAGDFNTFINALASLDTTQGPHALDAISGQPYASFGTANAAMGYAFANAVGAQMAGQQSGGTRVALAEACEVSCDTASRWGAWLSGLAGTGSVLGQANNSGAFTYNFGGTAVGLDYRLDPRFLVGVGLGYTTGTQWVSGFNGRGTVDAFSGSLYGSFTEGAVYVNAVAGYSRASNRLTRTITIPGLAPRTAQGQTTADQFLGQVETGYRFDVGPGSTTPFAKLQGSTTNQAAFAETGADSLNLAVAQQTTHSLRTTLGAEVQAEFGPVDMRLRLGWQHEHADTARPLTASFAGAPGSAFTVFGATPQRDSAVVGFGGRTRIAEMTELYARYDGEVGGGTDNHAFNVGLRMTW